MIHKLLIVSHVIHYEWAGKYWAYGPYTREIEIWANLFPEVIIAGPLRSTEPTSDSLPFVHSNISIKKQPERGGDEFISKIWQMFSLPYMVFSLSRAMMSVDAIHVRCPGNLGLLGVILAPLFTHYRIAKYAGQWNGYKGETLATRLQREILKSRWWNAPVTVYGNWQNQPPYVIPFFTSMMTKDQTQAALKFAQGREITHPLKILFSGRLTDVKRVDVLLKAMKILVEENTECEMVILGDGPERQQLEEYVHQNQLSASVRFIGSMPYEDALEWYKWADCLVLPSKHSEGWPKVIAEAMCYGVYCIAVDHGQMDSMLNGKGTLLSDGSEREIAQAIIEVLKDRKKALNISTKAALWSAEYSIENLEIALKKLIQSWWDITLDDLPS